MIQDLQYGMRRLLQSKTWTFAVVASLALGIGVSTTLFSLIEAVLLRELPVPRPDELVYLSWHSGPRGMHVNLTGNSATDPATGLHQSTSFSTLAYEQMRDRNRTLASIFAFAPLSEAHVRLQDRSEIVNGQFVSGNYFQALELAEIRGRAISPSDDTPAAEPTIVISDAFWSRNFARDPRAIGATLVVDGMTFTIVGITPPSFTGTLGYHYAADFSIPLSFEPRLRPDDENDQPWSWWLSVMGRLAPASHAATSQIELQRVFEASAREGWMAAPASRRGDVGSPDTPQLQLLAGHRGLADQVRDISQLIVVLAAIAGILMLVVSINVANLVLTRTADRDREIGVRLVLGAQRSRLFGLLLAESFLIALFAGTAGVLLTLWGIDLLELFIAEINRMRIDLRVDVTILAFAGLVTILATAAIGTLPALRASRLDMSSAARNVSGTLDVRRFRLGRTLLVAQLATSLVLIVTAGLLVRSVRGMQGIDVGFNARNVLLFDMNPEAAGYTEARLSLLYEQLVESLESIPGVHGVTVGDYPLVSERGSGNRIAVLGSDMRPDEGAVRRLKVRSNFMDVLGIPMLQGRGLTPEDGHGTPAVAVVNETLARRFLPRGVGAVGSRFDFGNGPSRGAIEIVGVVQDAAVGGVRSEIPPTVYLPYRQHVPDKVTFALRTQGSPLQLAPSVRETVRQLAPELPLLGMRTQYQQVRAGFARERILANAASFFAVISLLIACVGLYGIIAHSVYRRTREIGVRMALGARQYNIVWLVLRETVVVLGLAGLVGGIAALLFARTLSTLLYGVTPYDPMTLAMAIMALAATGVLAGYLPARRAMRVEPLVAIRHD